jgi:hypothetical protein
MGRHGRLLPTAPLLLLLLVAAMASAPVAGAQTQSAAFTVEGLSPVLARYACHSIGHGITSCQTDHVTPQPTAGRVTLHAEPPVEGQVAVNYNQYRFAAGFVFAKQRLLAAAGSGAAQATWAITLDDPDRSMLWGTFRSGQIELRGLRSAERVRLRVRYSVEVSGGSGRFAGLTGACDSGACDFDETRTFSVSGPGQLARAQHEALRAAAGSAQAEDDEIQLELVPGTPSVEIALGADGPLGPRGGQPLQASAPPDSTCTGSGRDPRTSRVVDLGQATADNGGTVVFPGSLADALPPGPGASPWLITVDCAASPLAPTPIAPATVRAAAPRSRPGTARFVNNSSLRFWPVASSPHWFPPALGSGATAETPFSAAWGYKVDAILSYQSATPPQRASQGFVDLGFSYHGNDGCSVRANKGPLKATCSWTKDYGPGGLLYTVTLGQTGY